MSTKAKRPTYLIRVGVAHKRLLISVVLGLITMAAVPGSPITRILIGWDLGILVYLAAAAVVMTQCRSVAQMKSNAMGRRLELSKENGEIVKVSTQVSG